MKCPRCDAHIAGERKCSKCGLDFAGPQEKIEVEYKDFKTSELLEIRHRRQAAREAEGIRNVREHNGKKVLKREPDGEAFYKDEKKPFPFPAAMALILLLIAVAFFIFRYFTMR